MANEEILEQIRKLVDQEHSLRSGAPVDREQLDHLEATLDQCWDLLRQRRARREFGEDIESARVRDVNTVEHYQQ
jgi:hypothetical protein